MYPLFIFVCLALIEGSNVDIYPQVGVVRDPAFHSAIEMLLPENYMLLAKFVIQADTIKRAAHENSEFI